MAAMQKTIKQRKGQSKPNEDVMFVKAEARNNNVITNGTDSPNPATSPVISATQDLPTPAGSQNSDTSSKH